MKERWVSLKHSIYGVEFTQLHSSEERMVLTRCTTQSLTHDDIYIYIYIYKRRALHPPLTGEQLHPYLIATFSDEKQLSLPLRSISVLLKSSYWATKQKLDSLSKSRERERGVVVGIVFLLYLFLERESPCIGVWSCPEADRVRERERV